MPACLCSPPRSRPCCAALRSGHLLKRAALRHFPQITTLTEAVLRHKIGAPGALWRHQQALGRLCDETLPEDYRSRHEFGRCLPDNLALVMLELFEEIFVRGRGTLPDGLTLPDFLQSRAGVPAGAGDRRPETAETAEMAEVEVAQPVV
jgi:hypothetical protein